MCEGKAEAQKRRHLPEVSHPLNDEDGTQDSGCLCPEPLLLLFICLHTLIAQLYYFSGHDSSCDLFFKEGACEMEEMRLGCTMC